MPVTIVVDTVTISGNGVVTSLDSNASNRIAANPLARAVAASAINQRLPNAEEATVAFFAAYDNPSIYLPSDTLDSQPRLSKKKSPI
jgi:hypothetical protein